MMNKYAGPIFNQFEDATIVAFLALRGHIVTPIRNLNGRIIFEVEGDIARDIDAFYTNQPVGIMEYVGILKGIKSQIFTLKSMKRDVNRG